MKFVFSLQLFLFLLFSYPGLTVAYAQHQDVSEKPKIWEGKNTELKDTTSLLYAFRNGKVDGHFRYFFSATDNNGPLTDYFANAFGGGLRYETGDFHGFQLGISGFYVFNIGSSDLSKRDSISNQLNRYEIGLFDIEDPSNKKDIDRLEEFYVRYNFRKSFIRYGRQLVNTPFINLQDGRMRPTGVEGFWFELNETKKLHLEGGWLYAISPRSTVRWYKTAHSVGIYPMGTNVDGKKSDYLNNLTSKGSFLLGAKFKGNERISITVYDLFFENIQNSLLIQTDFKFKTSEKTTFVGGVQLIRQDAVNNGGNDNPSQSYIQKGSSVTTFGLRAGIVYNNFEITANYNRIQNTGRYLMPREWGRDPFFTFMPRERNDGLGDVHAIMGNISYNFKPRHIKTSLSAGYFSLPDVRNFALNKYGLPSYAQINADVRYTFNGLLRGLDLQFLLVLKFNQGEIYGDSRYEFNRVNMKLYNLVLNYHF
jgi:hypothetical protein